MFMEHKQTVSHIDQAFLLTEIIGYYIVFLKNFKKKVCLHQTGSKGLLT